MTQKITLAVLAGALGLLACAPAGPRQSAHLGAIYDKSGRQLPDSDASSTRVNWVILDKDVPDAGRWNGVGTVEPGCTATLLKAPERATAPAYLITAGHCYPTGELDPATIIVDAPVQAQANLGQFLVGSGMPAAVPVTVDRAAYATMKGTDLAILQIGAPTYGDLIARGVQPLPLAKDVPVAGEAVLMPHEPLEGVDSPGLRLSSCTVGATVATLQEAAYRSAGPFRNHCSAVGGTSGAPVVSEKTGRIIGILTTGTRQSTAGQPDCEDSRPCEVQADGSGVTLPGENYAQHVYQVAGCFAATGVFDLTRAGCGLERPPANH